MAMYDMPNQEVVRVNPPGPPVDGGDPGPTGAYDPGAYTVDEVKSYVTDHPDERGPITQAETAGKARSSLLDWLGTV